MPTKSVPVTICARVATALLLSLVGVRTPRAATRRRRPRISGDHRGPPLARRERTPRAAVHSPVVPSPEKSQQLAVAHLDADAFYVAVELARHPELAGKPVVVAHNGARAVVTTASYEARAYGVGSAMPAARARRLCPQAIFVEPDFTTYRDVSRRMMEIVRAHVERVEVVGLDEAYLDLRGLLAPRAAMRRVVAEIANTIGL